jgi:hypothetical protein
METVFPDTPGFEGFFLVGHRKNPANTAQLQRVGTVVLKRTYDVDASGSDPALGSLSPSADPLPVFVKDEPVPGSEGLSNLRYEHDLMPYKPEADLIVQGFTDVPPPGSGATSDCRVFVNGAKWLQRLLNAAPDTALFGWEPRDDGPRKAEGAFPDDPDDYPLEPPLPPGFNNRYYNGYSRTARVPATLPYYAPGSEVFVERDGAADYGFTLRNESVTVTVHVYSGKGPDKESRWMRKPVAVNLDTLVIEPDEDRCYVVWRGVWQYDEFPEDTYRRLVVEAVD